MAEEGTRVLIVEDDPATAELERRALGRAGVEATVTHSIFDARRLLDVEIFDAVALDFQLPDGDAWDIFEIARAMTPRIPIVLVTAVGNERLVTEAIHRGVADYVRKEERFWEKLASSIVRVVGVAQLEGRLRESEERFRSAFETAAHGMALVSPDGHWNRVNHALCNIVGYQEEELLSSSFQAITHPDDLDTDLSFLRALLAGEINSYQTEKRYIHKLGHFVWILLSVSLVRCRDGRPSHFVSQIININERKRMEVALRDAKEHADQANRAKATFLANMSHEIRTPINAVVGFSDLLLASTLSHAQRHDAVRLRDAAKSLLAIVNDVLDLSKIEAGKLDIEYIALSPRRVVQSAMSILVDQFAAKGLTLELWVEPSVPDWIESDPVRLQQILLNLLGNALKFTAAGVVTIRVSSGENGDLRVEVEDTGRGIALERQHLLFGDFAQLDRSTARCFGGTGLGLAICRRLVEALGGSIGVRSALGRGSLFWFTIAAHECRPPSDPQGAVAATMRTAGARVLVAEDLPINQEILSRFLRAGGHDVVLVRDGIEAVREVQAGEFDLVLMDMQMPELDGVAATLAIRRLGERFRDIPIIALTANAMLDDAATCRAAGMNDFLSKPINSEALLAVVRRWSHGSNPVSAAGRLETASVLDEDKIHELEAALGVERVAAMSLSARSAMSTAARSLRGKLDLVQLSAEAHDLISTAGNFGCREVVERCRVLSTAIRSGVPSLGPETQVVADAIDRAVAAMSVRFGGVSPLMGASDGNGSGQVADGLAIIETGPAGFGEAERCVQGVGTGVRRDEVDLAREQGVAVGGRPPEQYRIECAG